ncbi:MAG: DUF885 domain-containing protein [Candidatus Zixiibacteriota bacterium]|nr:MAG: DUF885 domain-containing protein [candidate division Zixibacteria bacterium]
MKRQLILVLVMMFIASSVTAQSKLEQNFAKISQEILENLQSFYPVTCTKKGIHDYDYRFTDYSKKSINSEISRLKKFEQRLYKYNKSRLSENSRINLQLLKSDVDIALANLNKVRVHRINPYLYVSDAVNGIYLILATESAPLETRVHNVMARLRVVPDLFRQAKNNLKSPPPIYIELAIGMLDTGMDFYRTVDAELSARFPELSRDINAATSGAIGSMLDFKEFLKNITPGDAGSFAVGKENFDYRLKHEYFFDYDSDSLLKIGESLLEQTLSEYDEYLTELDSSDEGVDSVFVIDCVTKDDILDYYNWEVEQTRLFLKENDIVAIPDDIGQCKVIETPSFLTNVVSTIAYQPPGVFSPDQTGLFYVRPIPDSMDAGEREARYRYIQRRGFKGSVVHEAYPGHHLQFQMASRVNDEVRKWHANPCLYEGWALYCEEMMYENGFYGSDSRKYLNILDGILFRAVRIVVDVKLHTGQMTIDEAVQWMSDVLQWDTSWARIEVNRYTLTPTVPMSYLIGKLEILKLRDAARAREGESFSLKDFHDRLLSEGSLPPPLIREIWGL